MPGGRARPGSGRPEYRREHHDDRGRHQRERRADAHEVAEAIAAGAVHEEIAVVPDRREERDHRRHGDRDHVWLGRVPQDIGQRHRHRRKQRGASTRCLPTLHRTAA